MNWFPMFAATTVLTGGLVAAAGPVQADTSAALPLQSSFSGMVVDQAHGRVFVSGGSVVVADLDGTVTGSIAGIGDARQMALTVDGTQLVVSAGDGLTVVDAATATVVRTVATGQNSCPDAVAPSAGLMFFTYGDCASGTPGLGAVDLATDEITTAISTGTLVPTNAQLKTFGSSDLAARFGATLADLTVSPGATPSVAVRSRGIDATFSDFAFPGLGNVLTASPGVVDHREFGLTDADMREFQRIPTGSNPTAVATRSDGMTAYANGRTVKVWQDADIGYGVRNDIVFPAGTVVPARGLAFGTTRLFAVTRDASNAYILRHIDDGKPTNLYAYTDKPAVAYGGTVKVTANLPAGPTNRTVSIWAVPVGAPRYLLGSGPANRTLTLTAAHLTRNTTFEAVFAGDDLYAAVTFKSTVHVAAKVTLSTTSKSVSGGYYHRLPASPVHLITGTISPGHPGQCAFVRGEVKVGTGWRMFQRIDCIKTTTTSRYSLRLVGFKPGQRIRVASSFGGDKVNTASPTTTYYIVFT